VTLITAVIVLSGSVWLGVSAWRYHELDYDLTEAVARHDVHQAELLLKAGANPNARWSGYSWKDNLDNFLHGTRWEGWGTVLSYAGDDTDMARLLRKYGATR
jgi:hypothetical protein